MLVAVLVGGGGMGVVRGSDGREERYPELWVFPVRFEFRGGACRPRMPEVVPKKPSELVADLMDKTLRKAISDVTDNILALKQHKCTRLPVCHERGHRMVAILNAFRVLPEKGSQQGQQPGEGGWWSLTVPE